MGEIVSGHFLNTMINGPLYLDLLPIQEQKILKLQRFDTKTDLLDEGIHIEKHGTKFLYEMVLEKVSKWGSANNLMFVIGATQADEFINIRRLTPEHFYLVPGVGAQGGSLKEISEKAMTKDCGILVNASRAIIYASDKESFAEEARVVAKQYQSEMASYLPS
jgi:orotidine-5'-phosphate decarboxylase